VKEVKVETTRGLRYAAFFFYVFVEAISIYEVRWCREGQKCFLGMKIGPLTGKNEKS